MGQMMLLQKPDPRRWESQLFFPVERGNSERAEALRFQSLGRAHPHVASSFLVSTGDTEEKFPRHAVPRRAFVRAVPCKCPRPSASYTSKSLKAQSSLQ